MPALFSFEVHTPYRLFFSGRVEAVTLSLTDGEIGIYANHSRFAAPVICGILRIKDKDGKWRSAFITDGILEIKEFRSVLIVEAAEWPEEIDIERARLAKEKAEEEIKTAPKKSGAENVKARLRRAEFRLKAAVV